MAGRRSAPIEYQLRLMCARSNTGLENKNMRILVLSIILVLSAQTAAFADRSRSRVVAASVAKEVQIGIHSSFQNCNQRPAPKIKIVHPPKNGTVKVRSAIEKVTNRRHPCFPKSFKGVGVYYTPNAGFLGWEKIIYRRIRSGRSSDRWTIAVEILK